MSDAPNLPEDMRISSDEAHRAYLILERRELERRRHILDEDGISAAMLDTMQAIFAESLTTGQTDIRAILYCAFREAEKLRAKNGKP